MTTICPTCGKDHCLICHPCPTPPSKQSEECKDCDHALSRHTGVAGVGHTACRECRCTYFAKVATINVDVGEDESTPPKAEGVGEWEKGFDKLFEKIGFDRIEFDCSCPSEAPPDYCLHKKPKDKMKDFVRNLLTSATRAAEERKDGEWVTKIEAAKKAIWIEHERDCRVGYPDFGPQGAPGRRPCGAVDYPEALADRCQRMRYDERTLNNLLPPPPDLSADSSAEALAKVEATAEEDNPTQP